MTNQAALSRHLRHSGERGGSGGSLWLQKWRLIRPEPGCLIYREQLLQKPMVAQGMGIEPAALPRTMQ